MVPSVALTTQSFNNEKNAEVADEHDKVGIDSLNVSCRVSEISSISETELKIQMDSRMDMQTTSAFSSQSEMKKDSLIKSINSIFASEYNPTTITRIKEQMKSEGKLKLSQPNLNISTNCTNRIFEELEAFIESQQYR